MKRINRRFYTMAASKWMLTLAERRSMMRYLRIGTSRAYDILDARIKAAVNVYDKLVAGTYRDAAGCRY